MNDARNHNAYGGPLSICGFALTDLENSQPCLPTDAFRDDMVDTLFACGATSLDGPSMGNINCQGKAVRGERCAAHSLEKAMKKDDTCNSSKRSSEIARYMHRAKKQAFFRQLWLRLPTVVGGVVVTSIGLLFARMMPEHEYVWVGYLMVCAGSFWGLIGVLPGDRRAVPILAVTALLVLCAEIVVRCLASQKYFKALSRPATSDNMCTWKEHAIPCWYISCYLVTETVVKLILQIAFVIWLSCALLRKPPSSKLLFVFWLCFRSMYLGLGIVHLIQGGIAFAAGDPSFPENTSKARNHLVVAIFQCFVSLTVNTFVRRRIQAWFESRGEAATTAAGIAELLGSQGIDKVLARARSSFTYVQADRIQYEDMANNVPNPALAAIAEKGHLGQVDAFLSHSWHDDPEAKWRALQAYRQEFKELYGREPKLWIDKFCINQNSIDESLACLPVYLSGCSQLVVLCGWTYLQRLWCLMEMFVFLEMGKTSSNLVVKCFADTLQNAQTEYSSSFVHLLTKFDPRDATCCSDYDTQRLHNVIEAVGYHRINNVVRDTFLNVASSSI